jgi:hypothetical protein
MAKYSSGGFWLLAGVLAVGIVLGANWARYQEGWPYFWREGRGGTEGLKQMLKKDKTERLAFIIITEKNMYQLCSLKDTYAYVELRATK